MREEFLLIVCCEIANVNSFPNLAITAKLIYNLLYYSVFTCRTEICYGKYTIYILLWFMIRKTFASNLPIHIIKFLQTYFIVFLSSMKICSHVLYMISFYMRIFKMFCSCLNHISLHHFYITDISSLTVKINDNLI